MKTNYVLIDYENVQVKSLALLNGDHFHVRVFLGKNNTKLHSELAIAMQALGDRAQYVQLESSGANALDFHIAYYLGRLAATDPTGYFHIISKDTGFDPLIEHLKAQKLTASRSVAIEQMPCFELVEEAPTVVKGPAAQKTVAVALPRKKSLPTTASSLLPEHVELVLKDLLARKSARPKKMKTLLNTIHGRIGKSFPIAAAEAVREQLILRKHISVDGLKVVYKLPK